VAGKRVTFSGMKKLPAPSLRDGYRIPGFRTCAQVKTHAADPMARVLTLVRRQKKQHAAAVAKSIVAFTTVAYVKLAISAAAIGASILSMSCAVSTARSVEA